MSAAPPEVARSTMDDLAAARAARDARILEMGERRIGVAVIAARVGASATTVYAVLRRAREAGRAVPYAVHSRGRARSDGDWRVELPDDLAALARTEAARRGISVRMLARRLLRVAIEARLVGAILDDDDAI